MTFDRLNVFKIFGVFFAGLLAFGPVASFAKDWACFDDKQALVAFNSGVLKDLPGYTEPADGGTRVQQEHPQTYMFGQSRFLKSKVGTRAVCQYHNHVGVVAYFTVGSVNTVDGLEACDTATCKSKPHWRNEWTNSDFENPDDHYTLYICMETVDGFERPSTACKFRLVSN